MLTSLWISVLVGAASVAASSRDYDGSVRGGRGQLGGEKKTGYSTSYTYYGKFPGKCGNDGLYYQDDKAFIFCSNGNSYEQPCAPGTKNSAYETFRPGGNYGYRDFCDVNLNDFGYSAVAAAYRPLGKPGPVARPVYPGQASFHPRPDRNTFGPSYLHRPPRFDGSAGFFGGYRPRGDRDNRYYQESSRYDDNRGSDLYRPRH